MVKIALIIEILDNLGHTNKVTRELPHTYVDSNFLLAFSVVKLSIFFWNIRRILETWNARIFVVFRKMYSFRMVIL